MTDYAYRIVNVFAETPLAGNPLCVFEDARGLTDGQMQALARQYHEEVAQERKNLQMIFDSVRIGLMIVDAGGIVRRMIDDVQPAPVDQFLHVGVAPGLHRFRLAGLVDHADDVGAP